MGSSTESCPNHLLDIQSHLTSVVAQMVKRVPTMWETRVQFLGREDPLEREMEPIPVLLPGKSHGWRSLVGCGPCGC